MHCMQCGSCDAINKSYGPKTACHCNVFIVRALNVTKLASSWQLLTMFDGIILFSMRMCHMLKLS